MKIVLIVEDTEDDVFFLERALETIKVPLFTYVVTDGQQALDYLFGEGKFSDRNLYPLPDLILLDLNLPYVPGLEVLKRIRKEEIHRERKVAILTSSLQDADMNQAILFGADHYMVKPPIPAKLKEILET